MAALLVLTNAPDRETALKLAKALIERRLAACVNVGPSCTSLYHWRGTVETAQEFPLFIKSTQEAYRELEAAILELHPYELPEIIAVSITHGLEAYLSWVAAEIVPL